MKEHDYSDSVVDNISKKSRQWNDGTSVEEKVWKKATTGKTAKKAEDLVDNVL